MRCPVCASENPDANRFCGVCGKPLHDPSVLSDDLRAYVDSAVAAKIKDAKVLEIETTQAIVSRLTEWAKLFGYFLAIPLTLLLATLPALGIHRYSDFNTQIAEARKQALDSLT